MSAEPRCPRSDLPVALCWHCRQTGRTGHLKLLRRIPPEQDLPRPYTAPVFPWDPTERVHPETGWTAKRCQLQEAIDDLTADYIDDAASPDDRRPLLARLDNVERRTSQPLDMAADVPPPPPQSKPPASLGHPSTARHIRDEAVRVDAYLRRSARRRPWATAIAALPYLADARHELGDVAALASSWRGSALHVLGLSEPDVEFPSTPCFMCGQRTIRARIRPGNATAWCTNRDCVDPATGRPGVYDFERLILLVSNADRGRAG